MNLQAPAPTPPPGGDLEIRLHGRGGQGGVTCAKILAAMFARLGRSVQTFGDYGSERSGAPVRAYTRISDGPISNRNKVYEPHHLLVLDPLLLGDDTVGGLVAGGTLLINSPEGPEAYTDRFRGFRIATVDATAIARRHRIGSRSVVIVNTTIGGAFARTLGIPWAVLEDAYRTLGLLSNLPAAQEAWEQVRIHDADGRPVAPPAPTAARPEIPALTEHLLGPAPGLKTGSWRSQMPQYVPHLAPCSAFCPAGNDVVGFIQALAKEGAEAAARVLRGTSLLGAVCGRVCPAPCMEGCNRREVDGSVNIRGLERWIADTVPPPPAVPAPLAGAKRFAIVGGGPAGLSAAGLLVRMGHRVTIFEGERDLGGVLRTGIPGYRLPRAVLDREITHILSPGVEVRLGEFLDGARIQGLARDHDAVVLATGLQRLRGLDGPGPLPPGAEQGIQFLRRVNLGEPEAVPGHVVVLGGGNTAMDCARTAVRCGASRVTVAYRRSREEMPAIREEIEDAEHEGIEFLYLRQPLGFTGNGHLDGIRLADVELGDPDATGRRRPVVTSRTSVLGCDRVLLALGQSPDLSLLPAGWELRDGQIFASGEATRVFAAGDLSTGDGTVTHAIGDGKRAATRALRALGLPVEIFTRPDRAASVPVTDIRVDHFARCAPALESRLPASSRRTRFDEVSAGLPGSLEAHRCFSCGHCTHCDTCLVYCPEGIIHRNGTGYEIDYAYCKGCGICVTECPRKAMEMTAS